MAAAGLGPEAVAALAFSATCSLVLRRGDGSPLALSEATAGLPGPWDVVVWMDHRAEAEAEACTATGSRVLDCLGGRMSPEMQVPKLMWLKRHRPDLWRELGLAADLSDFLAWRCSGTAGRSVCTLVCKWTWLAHEADGREQGWDRGFLAAVDLADLTEKAALPEKASPVGAPLGRLTPQAAEALGLTTDCLVAAGLIDAHAGALGTLAAHLEGPVESRLALIAGTSNCQIALHRERHAVPGVWGPYLGAVAEGLWCAEGGQSATGALLDHLVRGSAAAGEFGADPHEALSAEILRRLEAGGDPAPELHLLPDFIGNRSPHADPGLRGVVSGLTIEEPAETLVKLYWAAACSIAYGTRLVIERLNAGGYRIGRIHLSGGHAKSALFRRLYADATGCALLVSESAEPVLLGAAIAAAAALDPEAGLKAAAGALARPSRSSAPDPRFTALHERRYAAFLALYEQRKALEAIMGA
ncbi:FGGY-family pentulose kinase [Tistlia consotensis]|uniref:FGGY-family pentulose kinase n=1 Tax=Tistlia consotensis USBA 355 TaxID=560819 RepID=A0A1Y6BC34_9PROT|nr:FGGY-family pentulose kinase [Tistlia consotensis USBA 355]SNR56519.1 FGGY-family pentulose kinase [Tistlia consotensis]